MTDERCRHDLQPDQCDYCRPKPPPDPFSSPAAARRGIFRACYDGWCGECGGDIYEGDEITRTTDGEYAHAEC